MLETLCLIVFLFLMLVPGLFGLHMYLLMFLTCRRRRQVRETQAEIVARFRREVPDQRWPRVTTQLPMYNELAVAKRVIEAAARMDYPAGQHEVQVLDDSTDATRAVVDRVCAELRAQGHNVRAVRRPTREHYKAGALQFGLAQASGEFVAVFDADFVPDRGFLRRMIPLIVARPEAGCVQGRWGHLNTDESWLTQALSLGIDGHFGVEQGARAWNGLLLNFNGTGGIWRKSAIEDPRVGGWSGDTITEDLDLSYRAQLAGWKIIYHAEEICPAEIPGDANAIKAQQRRWATGSIQTARKLLPTIWRAPLTFCQKVEATIHLTQYSISVFMVLMALFGRSLLWAVPPEQFQRALAWSWGIVVLAMVAPSIAYMYARWTLAREIVGLGHILKLLVLGLGLSVNNCAAVLVGLVRRGGEFVRTPKSGNRGRRRRSRMPYAARGWRLWVGEVALGTFCFVQWAVFLKADGYVGGTFLLLYAIGLIFFGLASRPRPVPPAVAGAGAHRESPGQSEPTVNLAMRPNL